jgi:hypothetical protein
MKSSLWLRVTSIMSDNDVLQAMRSFRFETAGVSRTYLDFYLGFGFILSVYLLLQAVVLWQLATIAKADPLRVRPLIASFFVAAVASALLSWEFIFAVPAALSMVIAACLGVAFYMAKRGGTL